MSLTLQNQIIHGDSAVELKKLSDNIIDLTVTSPPYDNLRDYEGYNFDFETIAKELFRVTKDGGVVVWVVGDSTKNGCESLISFNQALYFKEIGFKINDTMIYQKNNISITTGSRYYQSYEYMFVLSKGKPKTFNPIKDIKNKESPRTRVLKKRDKNGVFRSRKTSTKLFSIRKNIWVYTNGRGNSTKDEIAFEHPAIFPEALAKDHILSWSNKNDLILDPFAGSGTTLKMAKLNRRNYLGIEISEKYCEIIKKRLDKYNNTSLETFSQSQDSVM
jgi:site-specific DNA-methyltransferase (adenine-specific)